MKKYLLLIRTNITEHKMLLFHIVILSFILAGILSFYGSIYGRQKEIYDNRNLRAEGYLQLITAEDLDTLRAFKDEVVYFSLMPFYDNPPSIDVGNPGYQLIYVSEHFPFGNSLQGSTIFDADLIDGQKGIIVSYDYSLKEEKSIGDALRIGNDSYQVVGIFDGVLDGNQLIVDQEEIIKLSTDGISISISINNTISEHSWNELKYDLGHLFAGQLSFSDLDKDAAPYLDQFRLFSLFIFAAASIALMYLYAYILDTRNKRFFAYQLSGADRRFIFVFSLIDITLIYSMSNVISIRLAEILYLHILPFFVDSFPYALSRTDLRNFYFQMLLIYLITLVIYFIVNERRSVVEKHKEGTVI